MRRLREGGLRQSIMASLTVLPFNASGADKAPARRQPSAAALVSGQNLSFAVAGRTILEHIDIAVHGGEIVTLIGPNGAGKTSLARLLLGVIKPTSGTVTRMPGLRVGYVPQRFPIDGSIPINVRRFLALGVRASKTDIRTALEEVGATHLIGQPISTLSGGEFQRVCLARALIGEPGLLVLDEPAQALDFSGEIQLYKLITDIRNRRGCGILMISHDLHVVMSASDRVVCISGHVCCEGVPDKVANHPEYARLFGPDAGKAVAIYRHRHDHEHDLSGAVKGGDGCGQSHSAGHSHD
jgi:zinc transport system ATP-binding protein